MKNKYFLLSALLLLFFSMKAQQITNSSFESWIQEQLNSLHHFTDSADTGEQGVEKMTDAYSGTYSVKLYTTVVANDTTFGYFVNFDPDHDFSGGDPYNQHVDSIVGYYKANVVAQDTAFLLSQFRFNGNPVGGGLHLFTQADNTTTWTKFKLETGMPSGVVPDTLLIGAVSSNVLNEGPNNGVSNGSWIQLDNIKFYGNGAEVTPMINNDFENWDTRNVEKPDAYQTSLDEDVTTTPLSVEKTTDATDGSFALKLNTVVTAYQDTISGIITNGYFIGSWPPAGGLPINSMPDSITYDVRIYRFIGGNDDWSDVHFYFKNNGNVISEVSRGYNLSSTGYIHEQLQLPNISQTPDTLLFTAWNGRVPGSTLQLDNILLHYASGSIDNMKIERIVAFPNPTTDKLHFRLFGDKPKELIIEIYDLQGKLIMKKDFNIKETENDVILNVDNLKKGYYLYKIISNKGSTSQKFIKN